MVDISIVLPGIRVGKWKELYDSIKNSTTRPFELIICGPYEPTSEVAELSNFKYIKDYGSPARAQALASTYAIGKYIVWAADDALFIKDSLDVLYQKIEETSLDCLMCKYVEGVNGTHKVVNPDSYFMMNTSDWTRCYFLPNNYPIFNAGIMRLDSFREIGGWDCSYEVAFYSFSDMAVRAFLSNLKVGFYSDVILLDCDHSPGDSGDHKPIHDAQTFSDINIFKQKYLQNLSIIKNYKVKGWNDSPTVWDRRFNGVQI